MAHKRGAGEGTIYRSGARWIGQATLPDGRRRSVYGLTRGETQQKLKTLLADIAGGRFATAAGQGTLAGYLDDWVAAHDGKPRTKAGYAALFRTHLGALARVRVEDLAPAQVQARYTAMTKSGLHPTTIHHFHAALHAALHLAVRNGIIPRNPCDFVKAPALRIHEHATWTREQVQQFLALASDLPDGTLYALALTTGLRRGELLGLTWPAVDLAAQRLEVRTALQRLNGRYTLESPKSGTSRRTLQLASSVVTMLHAEARRQREYAAYAGPAYANPWALVFTTELGLPRHPDAMYRTFTRTLAGVPNLPVIRFHDLRHTYATLLLEAGVPVHVVSKLLGHSDVAITLRVYAHVTRRMQDHALATISEWLPAFPAETSIIESEKERE